jgi:hypothetical protein
VISDGHAGDEPGRQQRRRGDGGSALNIVVKGAQLIAIPVQQAFRVGASKVFPLQQDVRPSTFHGGHKSIDERIVLGPANAPITPADIFFPRTSATLLPHPKNFLDSLQLSNEGYIAYANYSTTSSALDQVTFEDRIVKIYALGKFKLSTAAFYTGGLCHHGMLSRMDYGFFSHRALAAFAAICERFFGPSAAARAMPPFSPPRRPRATAAGFLRLISGGSVLGASPMDSRKTRWASWFGSRGRVFERSGMTLSVCQGKA